MLHASTDVHVCAFSAGPFTLNRAPLEARHVHHSFGCWVVLFVCVLARSGLLVSLVAPQPSSRCVLHSQMHFMLVVCADASYGADLQPLPCPLLLAVVSYSRWQALWIPRRLALESPSLAIVMGLRHSSHLMCVSQRLHPSFKNILVDLGFILVQRYLCLQTQNSEETNRYVSLAYRPCVWWCLRLLCCCPAVAGVLCMIMHCPGSAGYCCCLRRIGAGLCSKAAAQAPPT